MAGSNPSSRSEKNAPHLRAGIAALFNEVAGVGSEEIANTAEMEQHMLKTFRTFLHDSGFHLAEKNFEKLLQEKSGDKHRRNDGTINWYHEIIPILTLLKLAKMGKRNGGFDIEDMEPYGGLEVAICIHLRHDSVEDFFKGAKRETSMQRLKKQLETMRDHIKLENPEYGLKAANKKIQQIVDGIDLMTQMKVPDPVTGEMVKEDIKDYTARMVFSKKASPLVFMLKQLDVIHNFATMLGAGKFDPARRLKRCNEREDMYGPRQGFTDEAFDLWPAFKPAMRTLDSIMGLLLYSNFRQLETMEEEFFNASGNAYKKPNKHPAGLKRYAKHALALSMPEGLNSLAIFFKRLANSENDSTPERREMLREFTDDVIKGPLRKFAAKIPVLFEETPNKAVA